MKDNNFLIDNYIATNHWATCRNNFNSVLNVFNYYGFAFKDYSEVRQMQIYMYICLMKMEKKSAQNKILKTSHSLHIELIA